MGNIAENIRSELSLSPFLLFPSKEKYKRDQEKLQEEWQKAQEEISKSEDHQEFTMVCFLLY